MTPQLAIGALILVAWAVAIIVWVRSDEAK
jgi:hypothetical protein